MKLSLRGAMTFAVCLVTSGLAGWASVRGASRHVDPAQVVPLQLIAPEHRDSVAEVITSYTLHRQGSPESFPCHPRVYLSLLNEPTLTLSLWKDLVSSPVQLHQVGPNRFQGSDGTGASATWEFVHRSPRLHVLLCHLEYVGPRGNMRLEGRGVLVVHTDYYRKGGDEDWIRHDVEAYVKVDSRGWRTVAKTMRPLLENVVEDQVQEAGLFVSIMGRLVQMYPNWATHVVQHATDVRPDVRQTFTALVHQARLPGAFEGRPNVSDSPRPGPNPR